MTSTAPMTMKIKISLGPSDRFFQGVASTCMLVAVRLL
jgi:hypothetical protein